MDTTGLATDWMHDNPRTEIYAAGIFVSVAVLYLWRKWMQGGACHSTVRLDGKTVLITGASDGIGKFTAIDLARRGARVIMACRDLKKAEAAAKEVRQLSGNGNVIVKILDLASLQSIRDCAADILATEDKLHILINNAGVLGILTRTKTEDGFEMNFGVNHLGHFLLTKLLLPLLKESAPSRIVNVSSKAHTVAVDQLDFEDLMSELKYKHFTAYGKSKLANILFTTELSRRLHGSGVSAFVLHPGGVATSLYRSAPRFLRLLCWLPLRFALKTAEQGAQTTIYCAITPGLEAKSGSYFSDCDVTRPSAAATDSETASRLWSVSERLVGLSS